MPDQIPEETLQLRGEALRKLGVNLAQKLSAYKTDRRPRDLQALKDLRQYRGEYDPEVQLDPERSKVYPRDTRLKLIGFTAKMMELMFPAQEKNWSVTPTKRPNVDQADLQKLIQDLQQTGEVTAKAIDAKVLDFAKERAAAMEDEIEDQLQDLTPDYPTLCKHTVHTGGLYGAGFLAGPFTVTKEESEWVQDLETGAWQAVTRPVPRPTLELRRFWDIYPDLSARTWNEQEGLFDRRVMSRHKLLKLTERKDFFGEVIKHWLASHNDGNYKAETYDDALSGLDATANVTALAGRRYEVYRYLGFVSAKELAAVGVTIQEADLHKDILCDIWLLDNLVIKATTAAFGDHVGDHYHPYLYNDEEEAGLLGISLPQDVRDSQMKLCATDRMVMDNGSACCGPIVQVDESRLSRKHKDQQVKIGAFSTIYVDRAESPQDNTDPIKNISVDSHITDLLNLRRQIEQQFDLESGIPAWTMGGSPEKLGEAFRTSGNMSQMNGGANIVTKDQVRAFDRFTSSVIGSMIKWNMVFNKKPEIRGDMQVVPRGSISLVAKEVRGAAMDQMMSTLTDRERVIIKTRNNLVDRFRSRDLPIENIMPEDEAAAALAQYDAQQNAASQAQMASLNAKTQKDGSAASLNAAKAREVEASIAPKIEELAAKAQGLLAKAEGEKHGNELDTLKLILEQISQTAGSGGTAPKRPEAAQ